MVAPKREAFGNDDGHDGPDRRDRREESREMDGSSSSGKRIAGGLTARIRDVLRDESDRDLLLDRREIEIGIAQWLRALDLHVLGGCRADERLKPLLQLNISNGVAEDMLLAQLSQHFEVSEIGMLARCLCIPLVSIRVGKVTKQGNLLCPSTTRGHLKLALLPSSNLSISFTGDDGHTERLATLNTNSDSSEVVLEGISADSSGRSFLLRLPGSKEVYFWCSEKSKLHGLGLLAKMKDLLRRKPTLTHLTGICESRLQSFAVHLRTYLIGASSDPEIDSVAPSAGSSNVVRTDSSVCSPSQVLKSSRSHLRAPHGSKMPLSHQDSLCPRPNTFKDGTVKGSSFMRSGIREKIRRHEDSNTATFRTGSQPITSASLCGQITGHCEDDKIRHSDACNLPPMVPQPECVSSWLLSSLPPLLNLPLPQISGSKSTFSPYYCWCPPCPSSLQHPIIPPHSSLPFNNDLSIPLPPLQSLFSSGRSVHPCTSTLSFDVPKLLALDLPPILPEPIVRLPLPVTSLVTLPTSQQISTFTPYMSDPIVHTPVIDVCSSGQGYLVSAGPAISSVVPPMLPSFVVNHHLIPNTESAVEKSARETLRMLMASTPASTCAGPMNVFPPLLNKMNENFPSLLMNNHGSDGLHEGTLDFEAVARSLSSIGLCSSREVVVCNGDVSNSMDESEPSSPNSEGRDSVDDSLLD